MHSANWPTSLFETSLTTPGRPSWAAWPENRRSVVMATFVPPSPAGLSAESTVASAPPLPRVSRALTPRRTVLASSSRSSSFTLARNCMPTGPSLIASSDFQVCSSTTSSSFAPGMQGTTRSASSRISGVRSGDAGTSKSCSSRNALLPGRAIRDRDDLGADRDRDLLRRAGGDRQPDGRVDALELLLGDALGQELLPPPRRGLAAAHRADVAGRGRQRRLQGGHVELGVVGEHADRRAGVDRRGLEELVGPPRDQLVGVREALGRDEDRARVADRDAVAQELADRAQRRGEVDGAEDVHG